MTHTKSTYSGDIAMQLFNLFEDVWLHFHLHLVPTKIA